MSDKMKKRKRRTVIALWCILAVSTALFLRAYSGGAPRARETSCERSYACEV